MSNLIEHARREMEMAGLFSKEADYDGMIAPHVMKLIEVFSSEGHSGFSAGLTVDLFRRVAMFENLTPLTDKPEEWNNVSEAMGRECWQSNRKSSCFSDDGGLHYYDSNEPKENGKPKLHKTKCAEKGDPDEAGS